MKKPTTTASLDRPISEAIPNILSYPMRGTAFSIWLVLIGLDVFSLFPLIGWFIGFIGFLVGTKYALEVLRDTAYGNLDPPEFSANIQDGTLLKFLLVCIIIAGIIVYTGIVTASLGVTAFAAIMLLVVFPAITMSLAIDESLTSAINPGTWVRIISRIGLVYGLVVVLLFAGFMTSQWWALVAQGLIANILGSTIASAIKNWNLIVAFHLMGYLVYHYRNQLGFDPAQFEEGGFHTHERDHALLDAVNARLQENDRHAARQLIEQDIEQRAVGTDVHLQYRALLSQENDRSGLILHGQRWLHQLCVEKDANNLIKLVSECLVIDPNFPPIEISDLEYAYQLAKNRNQSHLQLDILSNLISNGRSDSRYANWCLQAAKIHVDRFGRIEQAKQLLEQANAFADTELRDEIVTFKSQLPKN